MVYGDSVVIDGAELSLSVRVDPGELSLTNSVEEGADKFMPILPRGYEGETTVTPTEDQQTLATAGLVVPVDIVVNPIPSNYGLITFNGSIITVS